MAAVFIVEGRVSSNPKQDAGEESAQREGAQRGSSSLKVDDDARGQPCKARPRSRSHPHPQLQLLVTLLLTLGQENYLD